MLASQFIERLKDLIYSVGDVEVIIRIYGDMHEPANLETQKVVEDGRYYKSQEYDNDKTLIKVF
jgi:hypothetical protein